MRLEDSILHSRTHCQLTNKIRERLGSRDGQISQDHPIIEIDPQAQLKDWSGRDQNSTHSRVGAPKWTRQCGSIPLAEELCPLTSDIPTAHLLSYPLKFFKEPISLLLEN